MAGIEILSVEQVAIAWEYNWIAFWIMLAIVLVIAAFVGVVGSVQKDDWSELACALIVGLILGSVLATLIGGICETPTEYADQFKVTISDEVSLNEFNEQYKIIDQEGKIYTVRERVEQ